jgi:hypothetical protein
MLREYQVLLRQLTAGQPGYGGINNLNINSDIIKKSPKGDFLIIQQAVN